MVDWKSLTPEQRNALVAEKVMRWQPKECDGEIGEQPISPDGWFCQKCGVSGSWGDDYTHEERPRPYSKHIGIAWLVVEEMKKGEWSNFCYELDGVLTQHKRGWDASAKRPYVTWFEQFMKSLNAEGICIAALRTCGVEVSDA